MEFLLIGFATAANLIVIKMKVESKRYEDAIFDALLLVLLSAVFGGSYAGLVVGTIASAFISAYLYASPPKFFSGDNGYLKEFLRRTKRKGSR